MIALLSLDTSSFFFSQVSLMFFHSAFTRENIVMYDRTTHPTLISRILLSRRGGRITRIRHERAVKLDDPLDILQNQRRSNLNGGAG